MLTPELKSLRSPDLERGQLPIDPEDCAVFCEAEIGIRGEDGAEVFSFTVITPKGLAKETGTRWGRGYLIVESFSWNAVEEALGKLFLHCGGEGWSEIAERLNKEMHWEFESYRPYQSS